MPRLRSDSTDDFHDHISTAVAALGLTGRSAAESDVAQALRLYGIEISTFGRATARALQGGGTAYAGLPCTAAHVAAQADRFDQLDKAREDLEKRLAQVKQEQHLVRAELGRCAGLVLQTTDATLLNPTLAASHDKVRAAAADLLALRDRRAGRRRAAMLHTRTLKAESADRISTLETELAQADLKVRYLSGEELRPGDLTPRTPARARRRRPR